jgi:hypothetical protein
MPFKTPEERKAYQRAYYKTHAARYRAAARARYQLEREGKISYVRDWVARNRDRVRKTSLNSYLKRTYGISYEDYHARLEAQGHKCAICGVHADDLWSKHRRLVVDHNHATGLVRSLLCQQCNTVIGMARESPSVLTSAITYLTTERK